MKYVEPKPISKEAVEEALSGPEDLARDALVRAAYTIDDREWVESILVSALSDERVEVRRGGIIGLWDLMHRYRYVDLDAIIPLLGQLLRDPVLYGEAEETLNTVALHYRQNPSQTP